MAIKRVEKVSWEDDCGEIMVDEADDDEFYIRITNVHAEDTVLYFGAADFAAWVESEILPRYEKAKSLIK